MLHQRDNYRIDALLEAAAIIHASHAKKQRVKDIFTFRSRKRMMIVNE